MFDASDPLLAAFEDRIAFETLIGDLASQFVNMDAELIDGAIEDAQRRLVEALEVDRSSLFQFWETPGTFVFTHSWSRPGVPVTPPVGTDAVALFPWAAARVLRGDLLCISSLDELPADAPDREQIARLGTKSNVTVPLVVSGQVIGALAFDATRQERTWTPHIVNRLRLVGQVFAAALARKRSEAGLRAALEENAKLRDQLIDENVYLRDEVRAHDGSVDTMGPSPTIRHVLDQVDQVAPTGATVLLLGETGSGKEVIATAIHERSPRCSRTMVRVNCAAMPPTLIESELFGREKGAYTGAIDRRAGRFELAHGSTIFLDEVGELPADMQVKLLRVLQEREVERLGGTRPIKVDVRVIAATNRDLERAVADGRFREDLYYRLNVFPITVPPLRDRCEDIPVLLRAFVDECAKAIGKRIESISKDQIAMLQRYPWPGNVRELRNVVERAVIVSRGNRLVIEPPRARSTGHRRSVRLDDVERDHIRAVLERTRWRIRGQGGAADLLGLKPSTLEGRMRKLQLRRPPA